MKRLILLCAGLALALPAGTQAATGIANSAHDWSKEAWNVKRDLCGPCHMAHGTDPNNQLIPLWGHATSARTFTPFTSPTLVKANVTIGQPTGTSKACLSCHDGSLAVNQYGGGVQGGTERKVNSDYWIGASGDLRGDHPVSFTYDTALSQTIPYGSLYDPHTRVLGEVVASGNNLAGDTIEKALLSPDPASGKYQLQCASCHDVHRQRGDAFVNSDANLTSPDHNPLLVINGLGKDGTGSALCRTCHNK